MEEFIISQKWFNHINQNVDLSSIEFSNSTYFNPLGIEKEDLPSIYYFINGFKHNVWHVMCVEEDAFILQDRKSENLIRLLNALYLLSGEIGNDDPEKEASSYYHSCLYSEYREGFKFEYVPRENIADHHILRNFLGK